MITITQKGDKVGTNLSQKGSSKLRAEISGLKSRISDLAENAQKKIEILSEIINEKQEEHDEGLNKETKTRAISIASDALAS